MSVTSINRIKDHLDRLQTLVDLEVDAVRKILSEQLPRTDEERDAINKMIDTFLEQNSWSINRLRGSLQLNALIKKRRESIGAPNQQPHPTKKILLRD